MTLVDLNDGSVAPEGGEIVRDENGRATGMMRESAQDVFRQAFSGHQGRRPAGVAEDEMRRMVLLAGDAVVAAWNNIVRRGRSAQEDVLIEGLPERETFRWRLYMAFEEEAADMQERLAEYRMVGYGNNFLTVRAIGEKVLDGALGTHGGWLLEPYADLPRSSGLNVVSIEAIEASARPATCRSRFATCPVSCMRPMAMAVL